MIYCIGGGVVVCPSNHVDASMIAQTVEGDAVTLVFLDPDAVLRAGQDMIAVAKKIKERRGEK